MRGLTSLSFSYTPRMTSPSQPQLSPHSWLRRPSCACARVRRRGAHMRLPFCAMSSMPRLPSSTTRTGSACARSHGSFGSSSGRSLPSSSPRHSPLLNTSESQGHTQALGWQRGGSSSGGVLSVASTRPRGGQAEAGSRYSAHSVFGWLDSSCSINGKAGATSCQCYRSKRTRRSRCIIYLTRTSSAWGERADFSDTLRPLI
mmetsp:Transcript_33002/g.54549  ORF Transcript_33002/g.54549 Transcript_33002/m.54549 type:complete len:202 (+) Transcript_33002:375-980(+)